MWGKFEPQPTLCQDVNQHNTLSFILLVFQWQRTLWVFRRWDIRLCSSPAQMQKTLFVFAAVEIYKHVVFPCFFSQKISLKHCDRNKWERYLLWFSPAPTGLQHLSDRRVPPDKAICSLCATTQKTLEYTMAFNPRDKDISKIIRSQMRTSGCHKIS